MARRPIQAKLDTDTPFDPKRRFWRMGLFDGAGNPIPIQAILDRLVALEEAAGIAVGPGGDSFVSDVSGPDSGSGGDIGDTGGGTIFTGTITYANDATNGTALVIDDDGRSATALGFGTTATRQNWIDDLASVGGVKYIASPDGKTFALIRSNVATPATWIDLSQGIFELNLSNRGIDPATVYSDPWPPVLPARATNISYATIPNVAANQFALLNNRNSVDAINLIAAWGGGSAAALATQAASGVNVPMKYNDLTSRQSPELGDIWAVGRFDAVNYWAGDFQQHTWAEFETWLALVELPPWGNTSGVPSWMP